MPSAQPVPDLGGDPVDRPGETEAEMDPCELRLDLLPGPGDVRPHPAQEGLSGLRYFDAAGKVVEMPGHATSTGTNPATDTGNPSDGSRGEGSSGGEQDSDNGSDQ